VCGGEYVWLEVWKRPGESGDGGGGAVLWGDVSGAGVYVWFGLCVLNYWVLACCQSPGGLWEKSEKNSARTGGMLPVVMFDNP